jgi:hypothetical protein
MIGMCGVDHGAEAEADAGPLSPVPGVGPSRRETAGVPWWGVRNEFRGTRKPPAECTGDQKSLLASLSSRWS